MIGIPDKRPLQKGDIVNVDISTYINGYHGDLNEMFIVCENDINDVDEESKRLIKVAHDALFAAIDAVKPGMFYREIGEIITKHTKGYGVVRTYWYVCDCIVVCSADAL